MLILANQTIHILPELVAPDVAGRLLLKVRAHLL